MSFEEARVKLNKIDYHKLIIGRDDLIARITTHYGQCALQEIKKFAAEIPLVGAPRTVYRIFIDGMLDLANRPRLNY